MAARQAPPPTSQSAPQAEEEAEVDHYAAFADQLGLSAWEAEWMWGDKDKALADGIASGELSTTMQPPSPEVQRERDRERRKRRGATEYGRGATIVEGSSHGPLSEGELASAPGTPRPTSSPASDLPPSPSSRSPRPVRPRRAARPGRRQPMSRPSAETRADGPQPRVGATTVPARTTSPPRPRRRATTPAPGSACDAFTGTRPIHPCRDGHPLDSSAAGPRR